MVTSSLRSADILDEFELPVGLEAPMPPELRGTPRDEVRLMVTVGDDLRHRRFTDLRYELAPGDLLVVNDSGTIPAAVELDPSRVVHFSSELPGGLRVVEVRRSTVDGSRPDLEMTPGKIDLPGGASLELLAPFPVDPSTRRLWVAHLDAGHGLESLLRDHGRPISYSHSLRQIPLEAYQTVFATTPGSAEMPSAGRPFSQRLVTALVSRGVMISKLTLHTGVSSLESGEAPYPERYSVPHYTADLVNLTRRRGGRVIAVGTTVVRALETVTEGGHAQAGSGWTDLVIGPDTPIRAIDGMITGWHEPHSTHLEMLVAVAGRRPIARSYETALREGYLWHEFGDSQLLLSAT